MNPAAANSAAAPSTADRSGDCCEYCVILTKWACEWNEAETVKVPYYYYDYFLSLMEAGEPLPTVFDPA